MRGKLARHYRERRRLAHWRERYLLRYKVSTTDAQSILAFYRIAASSPPKIYHTVDFHKRSGSLDREARRIKENLIQQLMTL